MKLFVLIVTITAVRCYSVEKVKEINGAVGTLVSDAADNSFVIAKNVSGKCTFYKLNSTNDVILSKELTCSAYVLLNQFGDAYIFTQNSVVTIWYLEVYTTLVEQISQYVPNRQGGCARDANNFIDKDDIIYINHRQGVSYLRARQNIILSVEDLQGSKFCSHAVDVNGDVYLQLSNLKVVVITKKEKNSKILHSKILYSDTYPDSMQYYNHLINGYEGRVFDVKCGAKYGTRIKMLQENSSELLFSAYDVQFLNPYSTKEYFVFLSNDRTGARTTILLYILTPHRDIQNVKSDLFFSPAISGLWGSNSNGDIFYSWGSYPKSVLPDQFGILAIKPVERKVEVIIVPSNSTINSMLFDVDDNLWIIANGLYMLPKGADAVIQISDLPGKNSIEYKYLINQKKLDKEILIGLHDGLYICKN